MLTRTVGAGMRTRDAVRTIGCGSWSIRVEGPAADLDWLLEFVSPWFTAREESAKRCVRMVRDDARRDAAVANGASFDIAAFELDQHTVRLDARQSADGSIIAAEQTYGVVYVVAADRSRVDVLAGDRDRGARMALMRVVREPMMIHARRTGQLLLHAAAVTGRHGCVLLAGRKNSGKTSLLLHLLRGSAAAFLSNDRVAISAAEASFVARGIPTVVGIDAGVQRFFPALAETLRARGIDHRRRANEPAAAVGPARCVVSPRQLCAALDVPVEATGPVRAIVFPAISPAASGFRLQRLDGATAAARLEAGRFGTAPFASSALFAPPQTETGGAERTADLARRLPREVPCFDGILGPDAYRSEVPLARLLEQAEAAA